MNRHGVGQGGAADVPVQRIAKDMKLNLPSLTGAPSSEDPVPRLVALKLLLQTAIRGILRGNDSEDDEGMGLSGRKKLL